MLRRAMHTTTFRGGGPGAALLALALLGLAACSDTDERPATWTYISASIIQPSCGTARCHSAASATLGLQLDTVEGGYIALTGSLPSQGGEPTGRNFVVPGNPDASKLMWMLHGVESERMPPDEPLPSADIELIERWILAGARFE
jgi:hypothetical protein